MATGFSEIDLKHKEWIRRINEFDAAVINHTWQEALQNTLDFLTQFSETYIIGDEALMAQRVASLANSHHW